MHSTKRTLIMVILFGVLIPMGIGLLLHFFARPNEPKPLTTLTEISNYAQGLKEFPTADDTDWEDPHYQQFYKTRIPGPFATFLRWLGFWQPPPFSVDYLGKLLREVTKIHQENGLIDGESTFVHIKTHRPTKIIIFGDIHGAFHSLVRDLESIRAKQIIDDDLRLQDTSTYLVFNGDQIDRSPYNIDALILISLLIKNNPQQVFYVAGKHERNGHWLDYGLKRELFIRGRIFSTQPIPFMHQALAFFATLPEAVYVSGRNDHDEVLRISFNDSEHLSYNEHLLHPSFVQQDKELTVRTFTPRTEQEAHLDIRAVVKTEDWRTESRISHGLGLLDQHDGATVWTVLSSPIAVNRMFLDFFDDAFATINIHQFVKDATIQLSFQDSRAKLGFKDEPPLQMISARPISETDNGKYIKVASTMSLIRGVPNIGQRLKAGLDTLVNEFNRTKAHNESNIRLYVDNDDNIASLARHNITEQIEAGTRFFLLPSGTTTTLSYMDLVEKSRSVVFFPATGAGNLRSPKYHHIIHFRATYEDEAKALAKMLKSEYGANKIAIVYRDDEFGRPPFHAAVEQFKKLGVTEVRGLPYTRGSTSFKELAAKIKQNMPEALGFFSSPAATKEVIRLIDVGELVSPRLFALSHVGESNLRKYLKRKGLSILFGSPVPNPKTSNLPIAVNYRKAMNLAHNTYDGFSFEAYIASSLFLKTIEALNNPEPTPHQILHQIESMHNRNFYGMHFNFNPKTRSLATKVWLETDYDQDWIEMAVE